MIKKEQFKVVYLQSIKYILVMTLGHTSFLLQFLCSFGRVQVIMHESKGEKGLFCKSKAEENRTPIW